MRISVSADSYGGRANPAAIRATAMAAEQLGYGGVWIGAGAARLDPVAVLGALAEATSRVPLGLVVAGPWPATPRLARSLTTLDGLSGGRLRAVVSVPDEGDGAVAELLGLVGALPVLVTGSTPAAHVAAARATGWSPVGLGPDDVLDGWSAVRAATGADRDPAGLQLVARVAVSLHEAPVGPGRARYTGDVDEVAADLDGLRRAGAHELVLGFRGEVGFDQALDGYARLTEALAARYERASG